MRAAPPAAIIAAAVLAGCGGGASHRAITPAHPAQTAPAGRVGAASAGLRTPAVVAGCLARNHIPAKPYVRPAGLAHKATSGPYVLRVMPWNPVQLTIYDRPIAARSPRTVEDAGAVMASGNVALELDQFPPLPAAVMHTIEACAFGSG